MKRFLEQVAQSMHRTLDERVLKEANEILKNGHVRRCDECGLFLGEHTDTCIYNQGEEK